MRNTHPARVKPALVLSTALLAPAAVSAPAGAYQNPIQADDCPDPAVLRVGQTYYLVSTSGNRPDAFPLRRSADLVHWERAGCIFPAGHRPAWTRSDFWAPEMHRVGRRFL